MLTKSFVWDQITIFGLLPQTALVNSLTILPKAYDPWFMVYSFLFVGSYVQDFMEYILNGGTDGLIFIYNRETKCEREKGEQKLAYCSIFSMQK